MASKDRHSKPTPEEIITRPGVRDVKSTLTSNEENNHPADPQTGGGKVKSAAGQSEPLLQSERIGQSETKRKAGASLPREGSLREDSGIPDASLHLQGAPRGNKEGMAKSAKRDEQDIGTATQSAGSRTKPHAEAAAGEATPGTKPSVSKPGNVASAKMPGEKPGAEKPTGGRVGAGMAARPAHKGHH